MTCWRRMLEMSYMYISFSRTMTSVLRLSLTARMEEGKRSSQIMDWRCGGAGGQGSAANTRRSVGAYFCVDDLELARAGRGLVGGAHEGDERRAEEHLDDAARAVVCGRGLVVSAAAVQDTTGGEGRGRGAWDALIA